MKRTIKMTTIATMLMLSACNSSDKPNIQSTAAEPKITEVIIKKQPESQNVNTTALQQKSNISEVLNKETARSINSSGDKLTYTSERLFKGDTIYNQNIKQKGVVTGTLTVTLNTQYLPSNLSDNYALVKSTTYNYTLLVKKNIDIAELFHSLKNEKTVSDVEVAIDYSPRETHF